jgi:hypothetical protein
MQLDMVGITNTKMQMIKSRRQTVTSLNRSLIMFDTGMINLSSRLKSSMEKYFEYNNTKRYTDILAWSVGSTPHPVSCYTPYGFILTSYGDSLKLNYVTED